MTTDLDAIGNGRHASTVHVLNFFGYDHLSEHLQPISKACCELAVVMVGLLPDGPELTAGLRKLLEAKDCFVRAQVAVTAKKVSTTE